MFPIKNILASAVTGRTAVRPYTDRTDWNANERAPWRLMPVAGGVHDQVALGHLGHHLDRLGQRFVVYPEMLHGIQMETHSNAAVVHRRDDVGDQLLGL